MSGGKVRSTNCTPKRVAALASRLSALPRWPSRFRRWEQMRPSRWANTISPARGKTALSRRMAIGLGSMCAKGARESSGSRRLFRTRIRWRAIPRPVHLDRRDDLRGAGTSCNRQSMRAGALAIKSPTSQRRREVCYPHGSGSRASPRRKLRRRQSIEGASVEIRGHDLRYDAKGTCRQGFRQTAIVSGSWSQPPERRLPLSNPRARLSRQSSRRSPRGAVLARCSSGSVGDCSSRNAGDCNIRNERAVVAS